MACGVPCVLTDIPCHHGYGDEQYALFVPPSNPVEMAEAIVLAARHESTRAALRAAGLLTARRHTFDGHVTDLENALATVLAAHRTDAPATPTATGDTPAPAAVLTPAPRPGTPGDAELSQLTQAAAETLRGLEAAYAAIDRPDDAARHREAADLLTASARPRP
jgi:hypothetical protein